METLIVLIVIGLITYWLIVDIHPLVHTDVQAVGTHTCSKCGSDLEWNGSTWLCPTCNK